MANIAILIDSLAGGGAEKVMLTLASTLLRAQHKVYFFSLKNTVAYDLEEGIKVIFPLSGYNKTLRGYGKRKEQAALVKKSVAEIESKIGQFDLVLINLFEAMKVAQVCDFANSYYIIHRDIESELSRELKLGPIKYFYMRRVVKQLTGKHLITVSKQLVTNIQSSNLFKPASVKCIYNPINTKLIQSLCAQTLNEYPKHFILHVGRAAKAKRHDILFQAMHQVCSDVVLVCLAQRTKKLEKLAKKHKISDRVILPGFQQNPYAWMARAKAVVLSSDFEGLPTVLIEALACGTKIVSTDCPTGPNEILTGHLKNYLTPMGDPQALANAINHAINDDKIGEPPILNLVAPDKVAEQYLSLIHQ